MPTLRIETTRKTFGYLPAWKCVSAAKGVFYLCGRCFARRGDGPATNSAEMWYPGGDASGTSYYGIVPKDARCEDCGGRTWPSD
jgi:hypothetical protein